MPFVTVGEENSGRVELYYEDHGRGSPVVLIHGYPLSERAWERQVKVLLDAGCRVITYDRRGYGQSSKPASGYDNDTFAHDLEGLLVTLELNHVSLVGSCMGGGEVARYLGRYGSARVDKAVFVSSITPFLLRTDDNPEGVDRSAFDVLAAGHEHDRPAFLADFIRQLFNFDLLGGDLVSEEDVRFYWNVAVEAAPQATLTSIDAWLEDFRQDLRQIEIPTLVIHGDADRLAPYDSSGRRTHELIRGSRLVLISGGPHGIGWTHADQVNDALVHFLAQGSGGDHGGNRVA